MNLNIYVLCNSIEWSSISPDPNIAFDLLGCKHSLAVWPFGRMISLAISQIAISLAESASYSENRKYHNYGSQTNIWAHGRIQRGGGGRGPDPPLKNHNNIGFLCNTGPEPVRNRKATKPAFNAGPSSARQRNTISMAFRWRADDGPFIAVFGSSIPSSTNFFIKFGPPLARCC